MAEASDGVLQPRLAATAAIGRGPAGRSWFGVLLRLRILAAVLLALAAPAAVAHADGHANLDALEGLFPAEATATEGGPTDLAPETGAAPAGAPPASEATLRAWDASRERLYRYHSEALDHRMTVFRWQYRSSVAIFAVVVLIVAVGLYFSWMQFHASDRGREIKPSSLEASAGGLKVSSPVLGVIILALSLGFFYLYLVHVYPIFEVF